jgi:hypothetical protein
LATKNGSTNTAFVFPDSDREDCDAAFRSEVTLLGVFNRYWVGPAECICLWDR